MKFKVLLKNGNEIEMEDKKIHCNDVIFPWEFNPNDVGLFVVFNQFGPIFMVWGSEHEILDISVDLNLMDQFLIEQSEIDKMDKEEEEELTRLGNASEPFDLAYVGIEKVNLYSQDIKLMCKLAEARGLGEDTLDF